MAVKKQNWSSRLEIAWALEFIHEDGIEHELWLFRTKAGALRALDRRMRMGMAAYGTPGQIRAELEALVASGEDNAAALIWWDLYHEEFHIEEYEIED